MALIDIFYVVSKVAYDLMTISSHSKVIGRDLAAQNNRVSFKAAA